MATAGNQMTMVSTLSFPEMVSLVRYQFEYARTNYPRNAEQLFIKMNMPYNTGNSRKIKEVDSEMYSRLKKEGADAYKLKTAVGYEKDIIVKRIGGEVVITWEARMQGRDPEIISNITNISETNLNRKELDLSLVFGFATSTSYTDKDGETVDATVGDGFQLLYSAHTLSASSNTYNNRITGDPAFSKGSLMIAISQGVANTYNNLGDSLPFNPNTIITANDEETIDEVNKVLKSQADPTSANSGVYNTYSRDGRFRHVILHQLNSTAAGAINTAKRRWWFIANIDNTPNGWQAYYMLLENNTLKTPSTGNNGEDVHNDNWTFGTRMSYGYGVVSARHMFGSAPTN